MSLLSSPAPSHLPAMPEATPILPKRRTNLVLRELGDGQHVIKDPVTGAYFNAGEEEFFLLNQLDGAQSPPDVLAAFERRFGDEISTGDLEGFVDMVRRRGLLVPEPGASSDSSRRSDAGPLDEDDDDDFDSPGPAAKDAAPHPRRQSLLFYRISIYDPDTLFNRVEPLIRWIWTRGFLALSAAAIAVAFLVVVTNRHDLASSFPQAMRWESLALAWLILVLATTCHEFAHGLTCKHYGGEVHEVGVLFMFFTPCFFCNISDAWLLRDKSKRLWITLAGGYCDLCLWALAVFVWRVTMQNTLLNYLAWVVLSVCGARIFFNFNPLMKLDGYYLLSDWLEIPNLRRRGWDRWRAVLRWALWGAPRPKPEARSGALALYGAVSWSFSLIFMVIMLVEFVRYLGARGGVFGIGFTLFLGWLTMKRLFRGFYAGELFKMVATRRLRTVAWLSVIAAVPVLPCIARVEERAGGTFQIRPGTRVEIRAEVAGFLKEVHGEEGVQVAPGTLIARIEVPDLQSQVAQKTAAVEESAANLRRLEAGARPEEVAEQRLRVERARGWRDLAQQDLVRSRQGLNDELARLEQQAAQFETELNYVRESVVHSERLFRRGALAGEQLRNERKKLAVAESQWQQAQAQKRTREAAGVQAFEAELAKREKDLADTQSALSLLTAGARPEEIDAERARMARLMEELGYYSGLQKKLKLSSPVAGLITTPRFQEKVGQYLEKGALICTIESLATLEAEVSIPEDEAEGVEVGQTVELKARAFPLQTFPAKVDRIAPVAVSVVGAPQGTITMYCRVDNPEGALRSGMSGFGRVYRSKQPLASIMGRRALRYVRTEFWW